MINAEFNILTGSAYTPATGAIDVSQLKPGAPTNLNYKDATKLLDKKGFRYKDEATLIAMVTAKYVLDKCAPLSDEQKMRCGVIVSSNLGNLDTVVETARLINSQHVDATSAMALPNASSNVTSASIAMVFELRGPNLMLCNGDQSGLDALQLALDLMVADRADRVLVVAVEVDNPVVRSLVNGEGQRFHGGAGYLIEKNALQPSRSRDEILARIRTVEAVEHPLNNHEVQYFLGDASGATGILQLLLAVEHANKNEPRSLTHNGSCWRVEK